MLLKFKQFNEEIEVDSADILFIEASEKSPKYLVHCITGIYEVPGQLEDLEKILGDEYVRCHDRYIVNLDRCQSVDGGVIRLDAGGECPCSVEYLRDMEKAIERDKDKDAGN